MFFSLKWRLVIFISVSCLLITSIWTWQTVARQLDQFDQELDRSYQTQTALLEELLDNNYLKISQIAQLITHSQVAGSESKVLNNTAFEDRANRFIANEWISLNILLELDYIAFFDAENNLVAGTDLNNESSLIDEIQSELEISSVNNEPRYFIYCQQECLMVVIEPVVTSLGTDNTVVIAQSLSDLVRVFFNLSESALSILIKLATPELTGSDRYLTNWGMYGWAGSDFENMFPVIREYSLKYELEKNHASELLRVDDKAYLVKQLGSPNVRFSGMPAFFYSITDKTVSYQAMTSRIQRGIALAIVGLVIAELVLILIANRLMTKIARVADALVLLPKQEFQKAQELVNTESKVFEDELSVLEKSTANVAQELQELQSEINSKNLHLNNQVAALSRSRAFLTRLFDNSHVFIITQDPAFKIQSSNRKFDELYEVVPISFCNLIKDELDLNEFQRKVSELFDGCVPAFHQELVMCDKHNKRLILSWTHTLVEDESGKEIILSIGMDHTQQKSAENDLLWMANHDGLTGIGNRRAFNSNFKKILSKSNSLALVFIDVNRFKHINDIFGHSVGDQVLMDISQRLQAIVRSSDTISRFAGDEFTVLLEEVTLQSLPDILEKYSKEMSSSVITDDGQEIFYSVSVGAAVYPDHGGDTDELLINADMAMYQAKKKGLGYWHIYNEEDTRVDQIKQDHNLILNVKRALDSNLFNLVYQPIYNLMDGKVSHIETLLRLHDESGNAISPGVFIPLAERSGLIRKVDEWVLDNALAEVSSTFTGDNLIPVAINISAPSLQSNELPELIERKLEKHQVPAKALIVEITETSYIENFQLVLKNLKRITSLGVHMALDDFGVGFSSFTYLKMLPLTYVKLDGSYIRNITKNPDDQVFVKSLAAMINAFGMHTVAEFVENEETVTLVKALGVSHAQGFHLCKPQLFADVVTILSNTAKEKIPLPQSYKTQSDC